ncbi:putative imidazolonepropionase [Echinococcus granulosus]|nr:putative imidazolonepropionase [Echinococcus granulosus]
MSPHPVIYKLAASLMARAVSHLDEMSPAGVAALTSSRTAAVLLPTTTLLLHHRPPPAIAIAQAGVPIALGTDFRANLFCTSMVSLHSLVLTNSYSHLSPSFPSLCLFLFYNCSSLTEST